jgi:hypothetical protein
VAEIKVVMSRRPWPFLQYTDLLDFPGARAREKMVDLPADPSQRAFCVRNMLLRGKIAYLFQRYTEERELTCMLLCMPPSNQEVKDLTSLVGKWVAQTHGDTPQARAELPCGLFFVLTKFDEELKEKPGDTPESWRNRIDTRLEASMYQLYKQEEWLQNWNGNPFANTFFLRNPDWKLPQVFEYEADSPTPPGERGVVAEAKARIAGNRQGMLDSERCRKHFTNPALAWDSAMAFNDGGVGYLVDNLERVLSPKLKTRQLAGRLVDQGNLLDGRLRRFYQAGDDASRKEKEAALTNLRRKLFKLCSDRNFRNFAQLLSRMKLAEADVRGAFLNVASLKIEEAQPEDTADAQPEVDPWDDPWADTVPPATSAQSAVAAPPPKRRQRDRSDYFATQVLNLWTERVRGMASEPQTLSALGMDAQLVIALADELVIGAHRNQLVERIAERVRTQVAAASVRWDEVADRSAGIAAMMINDYVSHLGFGDLDLPARPAVPEPPKPRLRGVFAPPPLPPRGTIPALGAQRAPLEREHFLDWGVALRQLGLDNISFAGGREIEEEDNRALGEILAEMAPALKVSIG